jgi:predicted secreted protein
MPAPISPVFAIAIYLSIWWTVLFAVLPFGVRSQHESETERTPGTDPGAPIAPRLLSKALWTTLISAVVFVFVYALIVYTQ